MTGRPRSAAPKRTKLVKVLVTPKLYAQVKTAAEREGRSVSDVGQALFELLTNEYVVTSAKKMRQTPFAWIQGAALP